MPQPVDPDVARTRRFEIAKCTTGFNGFRYWLATYVTILDQFGGPIPFELWPCHLDVIDALETETLVVILKARQIGMSWLLGAAFPLWLCVFHPHKLALMFSWRDDEAAELITKCRFVLQRLPIWMQPPLAKDNMFTLEFSSGSRILAMPSTPTAGSSYSASYVLSDEHAKQKDGREQYNSIRPTIDAGGVFVSLSTAYGTDNIHYDLWDGAEAGTNGFKPLFFPYSSRPGREGDWYDRKKATYPDQARFEREYPRTPADAFVSSVPRRFDAALCQVTASATVPLEAPQHPLLQGLRASVRRSINEQGVVIYQEPDPTRHYVMGADVSEGIGQDAQAAIVLDTTTGEEVAVLHGQWALPVYARLLDTLAAAYRVTPLGVERNNHGHSILSMLERKRLERLKQGHGAGYRLYYQQPILGKLGQVLRPGVAGWQTTHRSKDILFDTLEEALMNQEVHIASAALAAELRMLRVFDDGRIGAEAPRHDDRSMALALAAAMLLHSPRPRPRPEQPFAVRARARPVTRSRTRARPHAMKASRVTPLQRMRAAPAVRRTGSGTGGNQTWLLKSSGT